MDIMLRADAVVSGRHIMITGSKSETNRLLLLQALYSQLTFENGSDSNDSNVMEAAIKGNAPVVDVHHAGTAMRFLTAYFAQQEGIEVLLTGSERMKERPIAILAEALRELGADIEFAEKEGFPPLYIKGKHLEGGKVSLRADTSSQYVTALLLIAPKLQQGLELELVGPVTSRPYIDMTLSLLREAGVDVIVAGNSITVPAAPEIPPHHFTVESDWSSASYYYSLIALSPVDTTLSLSTFRENSLQGDAAIAAIYKEVGVETHFACDTITLRKTAEATSKELRLNLNDTPDIAQTIAVTCLGLGLPCTLTGLHTLRIKETDRLTALKNEIEKFGAKVRITDDSLVLEPLTFHGSMPVVAIDTYNDHRMAMAFAPLALKVPLVIKDAGVVSKSYPGFWDDLQQLGFSIGNCQ